MTQPINMNSQTLNTNILYHFWRISNKFKYQTCGFNHNVDFNSFICSPTHYVYFIDYNIKFLIPYTIKKCYIALSVLVWYKNSNTYHVYIWDSANITEKWIYDRQKPIGILLYRHRLWCSEFHTYSGLTLCTEIQYLKNQTMLG